jgi:hypothetical protein
MHPICADLLGFKQLAARLSLNLAYQKLLPFDKSWTAPSFGTRFINEFGLRANDPPLQVIQISTKRIRYDQTDDPSKELFEIHFLPPFFLISSFLIC